MLADRSRLLRLLLVSATTFTAVAWPVRHHSAYAADDDDDDSASSGDDDDDGGAGDDDTGGGDDDDADAEQPPVTAGGLYTKKTYPIAAIERPLTLIKGMTEVKVGLGTDISDQNAFGTFVLNLDAHIGLQDNAEIQFGFGSQLSPFGNFGPYIGYEGGLSYDLVDFRAAFVLPIVKDTGTSVHPGVQIGFPFRYAPKPQVAIIALKTLMTIDFDSKPDLTPSVGAIIQPIPAFAGIIQAGINIRDFNTKGGNLTIPVSVAAQYTPSNAIDFGLQFTFPNLKPETTDTAGNPIMPEPKFYNNRALLLFGTFRF
jgi:hypothetical protein